MLKLIGISRPNENIAESKTFTTQEISNLTVKQIKVVLMCSPKCILANFVMSFYIFCYSCCHVCMNQ